MVTNDIEPVVMVTNREILKTMQTLQLKIHTWWNIGAIKGEESGQQIRSKIDSFQNANFLISEPNPMMLPLIGIVSERRFL